MSKTIRRSIKQNDRYIRPANHYNPKNQQCACGSWVVKNSWTRKHGKKIVTCVTCREDN